MNISHPFILAAIGGVLIGLSSGLLWRSLGRVAGISGICGAVLESPKRAHWRNAFVIGMVGAGAVGAQVDPSLFSSSVAPSWPWLVAAGLLVGFGTRLGSGCTSGHGVCGLSRWSPRSLVATPTFIGVGVLTVVAMRALGVTP